MAKLQINDKFQLQEDSFLSKAGALVRVTEVEETKYGTYWIRWKEVSNSLHDGAMIIREGSEPALIL